MNDFQQIYKSYHQQIFAFILKFVHDRDLAKDILQEVFIKIWERRGRFHSKNLEGYLYTISRNAIIDYVRKEKVRQQYNESRPAQADFQSPHQMMVFEETKKRIERAINALPPKRKRIFELSRIDGKTYQEIADNLNISKNTVEVQKVKALEYLRAELSAIK